MAGEGGERGGRRCVDTKLILLLFWVVNLLNCRLGYVREVIVLVLAGRCVPGAGDTAGTLSGRAVPGRGGERVPIQTRPSRWCRGWGLARERRRPTYGPVSARPLLPRCCRLPLPLLSLSSPSLPSDSRTPWHYRKINKQPINFTWVPETREKLIWCCLLIKT